MRWAGVRPRTTQLVRCGSLILVNGMIEVSPAGERLLHRILEQLPPTLEATPEVWLRNLCQQVCGMYLYAGPAREVECPA